MQIPNPDDLGKIEQLLELFSFVEVTLCEQKRADNLMGFNHHFFQLPFYVILAWKYCGKNVFFFQPLLWVGPGTI